MSLNYYDGRAVLTYRNAFLIFNPQAGGLVRAGSDRVEAVVADLRAQGHSVTPMASTQAGHASQLAREAVSAGADLVLVAGGDGTVNEVLNGMLGAAAPLAVLPAGTANVLAAELGLGRDLRRIAASLHEMTPRRIAAGLLRLGGKPERHFLLMAGAGFDADVVQRVDPGLKKQLGKVAYWIAASTRVGQKLPQLEVRVNGERHQTGFALASRVRNYGGDIFIARTASLLEDSFEVVVFEGHTTLPYLWYFGGIVTGNLAGMRGVHVMKARRVEFLAPPESGLAIQVDGEYAGSLPAGVEIVPEAISLLWTTSPTR